MRLSLLHFLFASQRFAGQLGRRLGSVEERENDFKECMQFTLMKHKVFFKTSKILWAHCFEVSLLEATISGFSHSGTVNT